MTARNFPPKSPEIEPSPPLQIDHVRAPGLPRILLLGTNASRGRMSVVKF